MSDVYEALKKASSLLDFKTYGKNKYNLDYDKYVLYYGNANANAAFHADLIADYMLPDFIRAANVLVTGKEDVTLIEKGMDSFEGTLAKIHKFITKNTPKTIKRRYARAVEISPIIAIVMVPYEFVFSKPTRETQLSTKDFTDLAKNILLGKRTSPDPMARPVFSIAPLAFFALKQTEIMFEVTSKLLLEVGKEATQQNSGTAYFVRNKLKFPYSLFNAAETLQYNIVKSILAGYGGISADPLVSGITKVLADCGFEGLDPANILAHLNYIQGKPRHLDYTLKPISIPFMGTTFKIQTTPSVIKIEDYIKATQPQPPVVPPVTPPVVDPVVPPVVDPVVDPVVPPVTPPVVDPVVPPVVDPVVDPVVPPVTPPVVDPIIPDDEFTTYSNAELVAFAQDVYAGNVARLKDVLYTISTIAIMGKIFDEYIAKGLTFDGISASTPDVFPAVAAKALRMVYGMDVPVRTGNEIMSMSSGVLLYVNKLYGMIYDQSVSPGTDISSIDKDLILKNFFLVKSFDAESNVFANSNFFVGKELTSVTFVEEEFAQSMEKLRIARNLVDQIETFEEFIIRAETSNPPPTEDPAPVGNYEGIPEQLRDVLASLPSQSSFSVPTMFEFVVSMVQGDNQKLKSILYSVSVYALAMRAMNFLANGVSVLGVEPITQLEMQDGSMMAKIQTVIRTIMTVVNGVEPTEEEVMVYMGEPNMQNYVAQTVPGLSNGTFDEVSAYYVLVQFFMVKMMELNMTGGDINAFATEFDAICLGVNAGSAMDIDPVKLLPAVDPLYANRTFVTETYQEYVARMSNVVPSDGV